MASNSDYIAPIMRIDECEALGLLLCDSEYQRWRDFAVRMLTEVEDRKKRLEESERRRALHAAREASGTDAEDAVGHGSGRDAVSEAVPDPIVGGLV